MSFRDYLAVIRSRKAVLMLTVVVVVGLVVARSSQEQPVYEAGAAVLLHGSTAEQLLGPPGQPVPVGTEVEVMGSPSVSKLVADRLGYEPQVSVSSRDGTAVVDLTATDTDAARVASTVNTYAEVYVEIRRQRLVDTLFEASEQILVQIESIDEEIAALEAPLTALDARIIAAGTDEERVRLFAERQLFEDEVDRARAPLESRRAAYQTQLDELQLVKNLTNSGGAQIVATAGVPTRPVTPTPVRDGMAALGVGLVLGLGLVFLFEYLDDTIKVKDDLEHATGATVVGLIPQVPGWRDPRSSLLVTVNQQSSAAAEAYRALRTSLQFVGLERPVVVIQVTSPTAGEGKTTTASNLAVTFARTGLRVVLVDCDLRRPRVHDFFGVDNATGFTSVLLGEVPLAEAMKPVDSDKNLLVLPSGPPPPNPSELLSTPGTSAVFAALRLGADVVLVDSPPVLPVADATVLAGISDAMLLIAAAGRTTRRDCRRAVELLGHVDAALVGVVLNGATPQAVYGYRPGRAYRYTYRDESKPGRGRRKRRQRSKRPVQLEARVDHPTEAPAADNGTSTAEGGRPHVETEGPPAESTSAH